MNSGKGSGAAAKFGSKNRNKKLDAEDRRLIFTKKRDRKQFSEEVVSRENLEDLYKEEVHVSGELIVFKKRDPYAPSLLKDVYVDGEYVDHVWVVFRIKDRRKLKLCQPGDRIFFTATVHEYFIRQDRHLKKKYGLDKLKLVKE